MRRSLALVPLLLASALTVGEAEAHGGIRATSPGPVDVVAGSTVTITAPTARLSSDCSNSQNGLDPSLRGVRYAWDIDDDGTYDVPASTSRDLDYSAALVPGPSDVPMRLQVSCWYLDSNRPQLDTDDTQFLVRVDRKSVV